MKLKVLLFAHFRDGRGKEVFVDVTETTTAFEVVETLGINTEELAVILVNNENADSFATFSKGDVLSLFPLLAGG